VARPSDYSVKVTIDICSRLAAGEPLVHICRDDGLPDVSTVYRWLAVHEPFRDLYAIAREDQADTLADQIIDIADTPLLGVVTKTDEEGNVETTESDMIAHRRLQVDARKWIAAKLKPKKYGDKVEQTHVGDKERPIMITNADADL
jgi:hypothetical protein